MHCVSCQAQLAAGSNHCYFCGTVQPPAQLSGTSTGNNPWFSTNPANEGWRIWASFFLGGLYAPIASSYLLARERAGIAGKTLPAPPSNRGLVVLGLFIGLPMMVILLSLLPSSISSVDRLPGQDNSYARNAASKAMLVNIFIGWFYLFSLLLARRVERNFSLLLYEVTSGSAAAITAFRGQPIARWTAYVVAAAPIFLICVMAFVMRWLTWADSMKTLCGFYLIAVFAATWATSWLHISTIHRFRQAALANLP